MAMAFDIETKKDGYGYKRNENFSEEGRYYDQHAVEDVITYIANELKTRNHYGGFECSSNPYEAIEDFMDTKEKFNQYEGQQLKHFVVGFDNCIARKKADIYAKQIAQNCLNEYQTFYGIHVENKSTHIHYAINTVSFIDGKRLIDTQQLISNIYSFINRLV